MTTEPKDQATPQAIIPPHGDALSDRPLFWLPAWSLLQREVVRFLRQPTRVIGALASPIIFWVVIGSGVGMSIKLQGMPEGYSFLAYFFPGTLVLIVLFTSIFATISIMADRSEGFLQAVLAAPVARGAIVLGKVMGGTVLALLQACLFLALAPMIGLTFPWSALPGILAVLFLLGLGLTALGYVIAWPSESVAGYQAIMNVMLMPLWMLSGALFPYSGAFSWVQTVMLFNPLYYGLTALHYFMFEDSILLTDAPSLNFCVGVLTIFCAAMIAAGIGVTNKFHGRQP